MVAFSCCIYDGGEQEKLDMDAAREIGWKGKFTRPGRVIRPGAIRINGKCPMTPLEVEILTLEYNLLVKLAFFFFSSVILEVIVSSSKFLSLYSSDTLHHVSEVRSKYICCFLSIKKTLNLIRPFSSLRTSNNVHDLIGTHNMHL